MGLTNFSTPTDNNAANTGNGNIPPGIPFSGNVLASMIPAQTSPQNGVPDCLINLNKTKQTPVKFRESILRQMSAILIGKYKPNVLLTGPAGTGKTAIVEELAHMIERKDPKLPTQLQNKTIYALQISDINAGAMFNGETEERVKQILEFLENSANNAIVFLDEIHQLISNNSQYRMIAQILKPALARGTIKAIGATTTQEAKNLDKDPAFNRRFTRLLVDELTKQQTEEIIKETMPALIKHYGQTFILTDEMTSLIVNTADEFCNAGSHRPDNAITLFDRSVADAVMQKQDMLQNPDPAIQNAAKAIPGIILSETSIKKTAIKLATGNNEPKDFNEEQLKKSLSRIKGQDTIIEPIVRTIKRHTAHLRPQKKPLTMLFMGPSGCGKTEVTKIISENYLSEKPITLNMTEYCHEHDISRIIGAPPGYVGYDSNSEMVFDPLESNPYQVILLDEFEKSDKAIQRLFMRIFDEGILQTNKGTTIDFSKSIIVATTNAGCTNDAETKSIGFIETSNTQPTDEQIVQTLGRYFDTELLNRFTKRYRFRSISKETFIEILKEEYEKQAAEIKNISPRAPIPDTLDDADAKNLADKYYNKKFNARPAAEAISEFIDETLIP